MRARGMSQKKKGVVGLGISLDEYQRMRTDSGDPRYTYEYPLIDLRLTRQDCIQIIGQANLPIPQKSACWFCPFQKLHEWRTLQQTNPDLFDRGAELETILTERNRRLSGTTAYMTKANMPLRDALALQPTMFEDDDICESGYCHT